MLQLRHFYHARLGLHFLCEPISFIVYTCSLHIACHNQYKVCPCHFNLILLRYIYWPLLSIQHDFYIHCGIIYSQPHTRTEPCAGAYLPREMSGMVNFTTQSNVHSHLPKAARHYRADQNRHGMSNWLSRSFQHITQRLNRVSTTIYCTTQERNRTGDTSPQLLIYSLARLFIFIFHTCGYTSLHPIPFFFSSHPGLIT